MLKIIGGLRIWGKGGGNDRKEVFGKEVNLGMAFGYVDCLNGNVY